MKSVSKRKAARPGSKPSAARVRIRDAREQAYRASVVEAAERLFAERGVEATRMEEIAAKAGLSIATLYSVFGGGKAELVSTVHRGRLEALSQIAREQAAADGPADRCLARALRDAVGYFMTHADYLRMHLREGHAWGLPDAVAAHASEGAVSFADGVGALVEIVERGVDEGVFATDSARRSGKTLAMLQQTHLADWIENGEVETQEAVFERYWSDVERLLRPSPSGATTR